MEQGGSSLETHLKKMVTTESTIKIVTEGRITKLPHIVRVRFIFHDGSFFVLAGEGTSDWVLNVLHAGNAKVRLANLAINTDVTQATEEELSSTLNAFGRKYGSRVIRDWYSNSRALRLTTRGAPTQRDMIKGEGETSRTFEDWLSENKQYYQGISEAFDSASEEYDFTISHNYINTWIRKRSVSELLSVARPEDRLIEVGCGTGAEALEIVSHVSLIVATDISEKMLQILRKKIAAKHLSHKIIPFQARAAEIGKVVQVLDGRRADAAYSFNGALNCEPYLTEFAEALSSVLIPGGYFVCSVRNPLCLTEALSHAAVLQFDRMAPRKNQPVMVSVGGIDIPAFYYSPSTFARFFRSRFHLKSVIGLPTLLPPAYLNDYYVKFRKAGAVLERLESALSNSFPFNRLGDQTLFIFQNR
jgi:SAM-dependent methyltransferase